MMNNLTERDQKLVYFIRGMIDEERSKYSLSLCNIHSTFLRNENTYTLKFLHFKTGKEIYASTEFHILDMLSMASIINNQEIRDMIKHRIKNLFNHFIETLLSNLRSE